MTAQKLTAPARDAITAARQEFSVHNMMRGAEILRDAARQAVVPGGPAARLASR